MTVTLHQGDCRQVLRTLPDESVHCVVTSPPYFGLRDYGSASQIGLESTPAEYAATMVEVFREVRRVLRKDGTLWLNLGDSYANDLKWGGYTSGKHVGGKEGTEGYRLKRTTGLKPKHLIGIPWRTAFALQEDGWYLRQDIIWSKPNPMPESITDRCTRSHEYIFLLSKSERYYYDADAIAEPATMTPQNRFTARADHPKGDNGRPLHRRPEGVTNPMTRNKRSVWEFPPTSFRDAHFAVFPPALITPCILAGTSENGCCSKCGAPWVRELESRNQANAFGAGGGAKAMASEQSRLSGGIGRMDGGRRAVNGSTFNNNPNKRPPAAVTIGWKAQCQCGGATVPCTVLDPFGGAGTMGLVADRLGRHAILIELNPEYIAMAERRIKRGLSLFNEVGKVVKTRQSLPRLTLFR